MNRHKGFSIKSDESFGQMSNQTLKAKDVDKTQG